MQIDRQTEILNTEPEFLKHAVNYGIFFSYFRLKMCMGMGTIGIPLVP